MMSWAVTFQRSGFRHSPVRQILLLTGGADVVSSALVLDAFRSSGNAHHTFDRQTSGLQSGFRSVRRGINNLTQRVLSSEVTRPPLQILPVWGTSDRLKGFAAARSTSISAGSRYENYGGRVDAKS